MTRAPAWRMRSVALLAALALTPDSMTASLVSGRARPGDRRCVFGASSPSSQRARAVAVARRDFAAALFVLALLTLAGFPGAGAFVAPQLFVDGVWP